jgi:hypothetical protein
MARERERPRDWHRLFGVLLADLFRSPSLSVEVERDMSAQQQFLDVVIVRRDSGPLPDQLPDGLDDLRNHNLITFKSHHETLDTWAMQELIGHYVAYRKQVSRSPSALLPEDQFRLYAVTARFPQKLSTQVPWQRRQAGVYDCRWGTDEVRVIVARELPREAHNALFLLFSASPELVEFARRAYRQRSEHTSRLLQQLFEKLKGEGLNLSYTIEDFERDYVKDHFAKLTPKERQEALDALPVEERFAGLSAEQIRQYLERLEAATKPAGPRKPRRKR